MPPFPSGEISLAPCAPAHPLAARALTREGAVDQAVAHAAAADITRQFLRAKQPCADGYRWYLRRQEGASNYQALLDDLVREGRVEDACWMLDQFGPTNDVLEVDHLEADALVFAGSVRCRGHADVEGVLRTGRSLSVLGGLRVPLHLRGLVFRLREADGEYFVYAIDPLRNRIAAYTVFNRLVEVDRRTDRHLRAPHTKVAHGYRRMGIATAIYRWWLDSGRCLMTGARQSAGAHGLWMALARDYELAAVRIDENKRVQQLPMPPPPGFFDALDTRLVLVGRDCRLADFTQPVDPGPHR